MKKKPDKYDKAIAYLTKNPHAIKDAWNHERLHPAGSLFQFCGDGPLVGCLTSVRNGSLDAATPRLSQLIRADKRIPTDVNEITIESLPVFAEWQRRLDKKLKRK